MLVKHSCVNCKCFWSSFLYVLFDVRSPIATLQLLRSKSTLFFFLSLSFWLLSAHRCHHLASQHASEPPFSVVLVSVDLTACYCRYLRCAKQNRKKTKETTKRKWTIDSKVISVGFSCVFSSIYLKKAWQKETNSGKMSKTAVTLDFVSLVVAPLFTFYGSTKSFYGQSFYLQPVWSEPKMCKSIKLTPTAATRRRTQFEACNSIFVERKQ